MCFYNFCAREGCLYVFGQQGRIFLLNVARFIFFHSGVKRGEEAPGPGSLIQWQ